MLNGGIVCTTGALFLVATAAIILGCFGVVGREIANGVAELVLFWVVVGALMEFFTSSNFTTTEFRLVSWAIILGVPGLLPMGENRLRLDVSSRVVRVGNGDNVPIASFVK